MKHNSCWHLRFRDQNPQLYFLYQQEETDVSVGGFPQCFGDICDLTTESIDHKVCLFVLTTPQSAPYA